MDPGKSKAKSFRPAKRDRKGFILQSKYNIYTISIPRILFPAKNGRFIQNTLKKRYQCCKTVYKQNDIDNSMALGTVQ